MSDQNDTHLIPLANYRIIGLSGKIGSGKTTLSTYLQNKFNDLEPQSFAENLRKMTAIFIGRPIEQLRSTTDKETMTIMGKTVVSYRNLVQRLVVLFILMRGF